jgi:hypothetical protein
VSTRRRSAIGLFEHLSDLSVPRDLIRFGVYTVVYNFKISVFAFTAELCQSWVVAKGASLEVTADGTKCNIILTEDIPLCLKYIKQ